MEIIFSAIDFIMRLEEHLGELVRNYGVWTYLIVFIVIFCETGLVVTPFLPGDSLLFMLGAMGANGLINFEIMLVILIVAGLGGNTLNYCIGRFFGAQIQNRRYGLLNRLIRNEHINKTKLFYGKNGGKAVFVSRFLPILRTFVPFVAGISNMDFLKFTVYNLLAAAAWVSVFMLGGYVFGNITYVQDNFTYVIFGIIMVSCLPSLLTGIYNKKQRQQNIM